MAGLLQTADLRRRARAGIVVAGLAVLGSISPVLALSGGTCPPPKKLAAGACVATCPGGFEDQGSVCTYRNQAR